MYMNHNWMMPVRHFGNMHKHHGFKAGKYHSEDGILTLVPNVDIQEGENKLIFHFEIPGVAKENIDLKVNDEHVLTLTAKRYDRNEVSEEGEEPKASKVFKRSFRFSDIYDLDNLHAEYSNGLLSLSVNQIRPIEKEVTIN